MDIILHLGVHRTGNATLHRALETRKDELAGQGIAFWGPDLLRSGVLDGLFPFEGVVQSKKRGPARTKGRLALRRAGLEKSGIKTLIVSDPDLSGSMATNMRSGALYQGIGERAARLCHALAGSVTRIALSVRAQDTYWRSTAAKTVAFGHKLPDTARLDCIADGARGWKDVVADVACAAPDAQISVTPFESHYANPLSFITKTMRLTPSWADGQFDWADRAPSRRTLRAVLADRNEDPSQIALGDTPWTPFSGRQIERMKDSYLHDMVWLQNGADGLAELTKEETSPGKGKATRVGQMRGQSDEFEIQVGATG